METQKIDRRITYHLMIDVETANSLDDGLVYDVGFAVFDKRGKIYHKNSLIIYDVFCEKKELMQTAYYAKKLPLYQEGLKTGKFRIVQLMTAKKLIANIIKKYEIEQVWAFNAHFDNTALNTSIRYITKSKYRWFLPYGVKLHCAWHVACQTIFQQNTFFKWAIEHEKISPAGNLKTSAETAFAYITKQPDFEEEHTGLADVEIEVAILTKCFAQHKSIKRYPYRACWRLPTKTAKGRGFLPIPTEQKEIA